MQIKKETKRKKLSRFACLHYLVVVIVINYLRQCCIMYTIAY